MSAAMGRSRSGRIWVSAVERMPDCVLRLCRSLIVPRLDVRTSAVRDVVATRTGVVGMAVVRGSCVQSIVVGVAGMGSAPEGKAGG